MEIRVCGLLMPLRQRNFRGGSHKGRSVGTSESQTLTMSALPLAQMTVIEVRSEDAIHLSMCYVLTTVYVE